MSESPQDGKPARLDRALLDAALFPHYCELPVRYDDVDTLGHVNNVASIAMLQEARIRFTREMRLSILGKGGHSVVAGLIVDFAAELAYPGTVEVGTGILAVGRSSMTFCQRLEQGGQPALYAQTTMVFIGPDGKMPVPQGLDEAIASGMVTFPGGSTSVQERAGRGSARARRR